MNYDPGSIFDICPNLSKPAYRYESDGEETPTYTLHEEMVWVQCIQDHCHYWDDSSSVCKIVRVSDQINSVHSSVDDLYTVDEHVHSTHRHEKKHAGTSFPSEPGKKSGGGTPTASSLISEYQGGEDLDANGFIYGNDFLIDSADPLAPKMIVSLNDEITDSTADVITWDEYLDSTSPYSINTE